MKEYWESLKDSNDDRFFEVADHFALCFDKRDSLMKSYRMMSIYFNFITVEVTWLDEIAEGLRNLISSAHSYRNMVDSLPDALSWKA